jgi:peptidoglycan/LPS O-acetylase OafA/YrhL
MTRNATLDVVRLIGAFGIVLFHAGAPGRSIGYAALPFFLITLILLSFPAARAKPPGRFVAERIRRLIWPWVIWSAVYAAFKLADMVVHHETWGQEFSPVMLLTGTALHLWFLPFAFAACLLLLLVARLPRGGMLWPCLALALSLASTGLQQIPGLPVPLAQWSFALPATGLGVAMALVLDGAPPPDLARVLGLVGGIGVCGMLAWALGWTNGLLQLSIGTVAVLACLAWPLPDTAFTRFCARASMTVYLAHPLIMSILERLTHILRPALSLAILTMLVCFAFALLLDYLTRLKPKAFAPP